MDSIGHHMWKNGILPPLFVQKLLSRKSACVGNSKNGIFVLSHTLGSHKQKMVYGPILQFKWHFPIISTVSRIRPIVLHWRFCNVYIVYWQPSYTISLLWLIDHLMIYNGNLHMIFYLRYLIDNFLVLFVKSVIFISYYKNCFKRQKLLSII